ncbi:uncharacterized protein LOC134540311 [Bacillus rossius redtenbacheri]|uniref:uncharacterized protein LOC134540311 n=1 Tax=Bacillus rossius redtenbacheri TaxID=93214 RepID=UPI002FDC9718
MYLVLGTYYVPMCTWFSARFMFPTVPAIRGKFHVPRLYRRPVARFMSPAVPARSPAEVSISAGIACWLNRPQSCRVGVTWVHRKPDAIRLLTVGRSGYSADQRVALSFRYPNNWRLQILYVSRRDQGVYECQVATHPPRVKQVFLKVTAPEVVILDENHHPVEERYYKAGSVVELTCLADQLEAGDGVTWTHGDAVIAAGISLNTSLGPGSVAATLKVNPARKSHSGNYSCRVGDISSATAVLHILNGEIPAAVHHGNSAVWHRPVHVRLLVALLLHWPVLR